MSGGPGRTDLSGAALTARGGPSRASSLSGRTAAALVLVLLAGACLRGAYLTEIAGSPQFDHPAVDAHFNDYWARALESGDWRSPEILEAYGRLPGIPERPYFRPPGYPYFLSLVYRAAGPGYLAPRVVQMVLGLGSALLAFVLARMLFGRAAAIVAAAFTATYWGFIYFEGELEEPSLLVFLSLLLLLTLALAGRALDGRARPGAPGPLRSPRRGRARALALVAGGLLGAAVLVRTNVALFLPAAAVWLAWTARRRAGARTAAALVAWLTLGAVTAVAPATIRNWSVARDVVPVSSNLGINLYIGNSVSAEGLFAGDAPALRRFGSCFDHPRVVSELERAEGRPLRDSEASAIYARKAFEFARDDPAKELALVLRRSYLFWGPHEITLNRVVAYDRAHSTTLRSIPWSFPLALALGIAGTVALAVRLRREGQARGGGRRVPEAAPEAFEDATATAEGAVLIALFGGTVFLSFLPFFVTAGYRIIVVPVLLIPGAYAATRFASNVRRRDARHATVWVAAVAGTFALVSVPLVPYEPGLAKWHFDRGVALALDGRHAAAIAEYERAVAAARGTVPDAMANLGMSLAASGRLEEAEASFREAVAQDARLGAAHLGLADVLAARGHPDEAVPHYRAAVEANPASARARCNLGAALAAAGRFREAVATLAEAVAVNADDLRSANNLAWVLATASDAGVRDGVRAAELAERVTRAAPDDAGFADTLAAAYAESGRFGDAIRQAEAALALASGTPRLADEIRAHLALYRAGRTIAEGAP